MGNLAALLRYLERADISAVCLQSDTVAAATRGTEYLPLTKVALSTPQIEQILEGTQVLGVLQGQAQSFAGQVNLELEKQHYTVHVQRHAGRLQVRFIKAAAQAAGPGGEPRAAATGNPQNAAAPEAAMQGPPGTVAPTYSAAAATVFTHAAAPTHATAPTAGLVHSAAPATASAHSAAPTMAPGHPAASASAAAHSVAPAHIAPAAAAAPEPTAALAAAALPAPRRDPALHAKLIEVLVAARAQQASDVHIGADAPVRVRRFGELFAVGPSLSAEAVQTMLLGVLSAPQLSLLQAQGYVDLSLELPTAGRMRVNIGTQSRGLKACLRLISKEVPSLEMLGLAPDIAEVARNHQGLVVISGPNGQGKTTTLAALVGLINGAHPHHILCVEDPVEIIHPIKRALISQREVSVHTRSFARALKAALREDPDVIVIGELRDRESVEIALTAAETGHLVLATMSTRSAAKTIDRLIDLFPPDLQSQVRATLAGALKAVISQRLVPRCDAVGLVAAAELMTGSVPLWNLIRENKLMQLPTLQQRGRGLGMIRFDTSLLELVMAGKITEEVAKKNADNAVELERSLVTARAAATGVKPRPQSAAGPKA
jgi:twitching motility protein PilT